MDIIKELLNEFDLANFLPQIDTVVGWITMGLRLAVLAGPVIVLVLGLIYLFAPPKEANHRFGFRCYYGMGSVEAWRFTQFLAGIVLGSLGLILTIIMVIITNRYVNLAPDEMTFSAIKCLLWEFGTIIAARLGIHITAAVIFDRFGVRRRDKKNGKIEEA